MKNLKEILNLRRASFFFLVLPYFTDFSIKYFKNEHTLFLKLSILIVLFFIIDILFTISFKLTKNKIFVLAIIYSILILFFYYSYILEFFVVINDHTFNLHLRAKYILPEVLILFIYAIFKNRFNLNNTFYILNVFFIISSIVNLIYDIDLRNINKENIKIHPISIDQKIGNPIILIITDEYASPDELMKKYKDSNIYNYQKNLTNNNWTANNHMYSADTLTINSLCSIFNFNFKTTDTFLNIPFSRIKLKESSLYDTLEKKNVTFYNYGIFDIGKSKAMTKVAFYDDDISRNNFIYNFFSKTLIFPLILENEETAWNKQNRYNIENTPKALNRIKQNSFIYIHLLMPHGPYEYKGTNVSFKDLKSIEKLDNYYEYWKFCNMTITPLLKELTKENKFRIILTGDHGYRGDLRINPHYTFTAFYGFDKKATDSIKSVQDIGSLINSGY